MSKNESQLNDNNIQRTKGAYIYFTQVDKVKLVCDNSEADNKHKHTTKNKHLIHTYLEHILEEFEVEKRHITITNFIDKKTAQYYEGSWHKQKQCKHGLGYVY